MLTSNQTIMIQNDFEKFLKSLKKKTKSLDFELFGQYASSILNFYIGSSLLTYEEKTEASMFLCTLFNMGMGNVISTADLQEISNVILQDSMLDYSIIQPVFEK